MTKTFQRMWIATQTRIDALSRQQMAGFIDLVVAVA
jgi:hypothetical protein